MDNLARVQLLNEHYRDTCAIAQGMRGARDRYFYLILVVLAVILFDVYSPATASTMLAEWIAKRLDVTQAPDLGYVLTLVRFLLLGLTIR